jgi:hypothetical protein
MSRTVEFEGVLTKTATYTPANSAATAISAVLPDTTILIEVSNLQAASGTPIASFVLEDSVDTFTTPVSEAMTQFKGPITSSAPIRRSFRQRDFPGLKFGVASARIRATLNQLLGTTPTVTYRVWLDKNA